MLSKQIPISIFEYFIDLFGWIFHRFVLLSPERKCKSFRQETSSARLMIMFCLFSDQPPPPGYYCIWGDKKSCLKREETSPDISIFIIQDNLVEVQKFSNFKPFKILQKISINLNLVSQNIYRSTIQTNFVFSVKLQKPLPLPVKTSLS